MVEVEIGVMEAGKKIHRYVRQLLPGVPLSGIHKMIRTGRVKVNGKKAKPDDIIQLGDKVSLYIAVEDYKEVSKSPRKYGGVRRDIEVVYEDHDVLIVNKPAGLLTHGDKEEQKDTLVNRVLAYLYHRDELGEQPFTPAPANRLDRNTSGLVVFGKTGPAIRSLTADISEHLMGKWYLALVQGVVKSAGEIEAKLTRDVQRNRTVVAESGKESVTRYEPKASAGHTTVVKIQLIHGRTHQIRAHFQSIGHPLVGDVKYGGLKQLPDEMEHQWLHAAFLEFPDGRRYAAPLPDEFLQHLLNLGYSELAIKKIQEF